jgi:hypothetical protein
VEWSGVEKGKEREGRREKEVSMMENRGRRNIEDLDIMWASRE